MNGYCIKQRSSESRAAAQAAEEAKCRHSLIADVGREENQLVAVREEGKGE